MSGLKSYTIRSPFKFLDAFELKDKQHFFGREKEVDQLYDSVNKNRLVMVYGQSGTGKTSLVQCGLAARFEVTDWYPIFVRRQDNINQSLEKKLQQAAKHKESSDTIEMLERINARYLRPVYLIFDQFEELLILGDEKKEQLTFIKTISNILKAEDLSCHIIFILREEFIAGLYHFEQEIPKLFDRRLRVEPMSFDKVSGVILKSCTAFNVKLENPKKNARQIIEYISSGRSGISLPYLQVYMDMLYREDFVRTYGFDTPNENYPELELTGKEIDELGSIENVLENFLSQQKTHIDQQLKEKHPTFKTGTTHQVLDTFVTDNGTKQALVFNREFETIQLLETAPDNLKNLPPTILTELLEELEKSRILHETESTYELAHDTLAALIDQQRTDEERQLNNVLISIRSHKTTYESTKEYPGQKVFNSLESFFPVLKKQNRLSDDELKFSKNWEKHLTNKIKKTRSAYITVLILILSISGLALLKAREASKKEKEATQLSVNLQKSLDALNRSRDSLGIQTDLALKESKKARLAQDTAELREKEATSAKNQANTNLASLQSALGNLQSALGQILDETLKRVENDILNLNYASALQNTRAIVDLKTNSEKIRPYMMELSFFFGETGNLERAYQLADTVCLLYGESKPLTSNKSLNNLRKLLRYLDADRYEDLVNRYYPDMIFVEGDTFSLSKTYKVRLDDYRIARTETTNWQYNLFCEATGKDSISRTQEGWPLTGDVPVVNVNWYDGIQYANWVSHQMNLQPAYYFDNLSTEGIHWAEKLKNKNGFRLPTEAEWEFAARGGKKAKKRYVYSGSDDLDEVGWCAENSNSRPHAVGIKKSNDLDIVDMSGNVWEWCWDWYSAYPEEEKIVENPRGSQKGKGKILRGGSWFNYYSDGQFSIQNFYYNYPYQQDVNNGFRLVQSQ